MRPTAESVRLHLLLVAVAAAAVVGGCGEGNVLESSTGPSSTLTASASLTADGDATASSTGEADVLKAGGGHGSGIDGGPGRSDEAKVVGFVAARSGDTLTVRGTSVVAGPGAVIRHGNGVLTMSDIHVGDHVQARGEMDGATLVAVEIKVQHTHGDNEGDDDDEDDGDETEVEGTVFEFSGSGSCPSATFKVGATANSATKVTTTNSTTFSGVNCATLTNGAKVEVEGNKQGDGSIIAASVELK